MFLRGLIFEGLEWRQSFVFMDSWLCPWMFNLSAWRKTSLRFYSWWSWSHVTWCTVSCLRPAFLQAFHWILWCRTAWRSLIAQITFSWIGFVSAKAFCRAAQLLLWSECVSKWITWINTVRPHLLRCCCFCCCCCCFLWCWIHKKPSQQPVLWKLKALQRLLSLCFHL